MVAARNLQEEILRDQARVRRDYEVEKALMEGKTVAVPMGSFMAGSLLDGGMPAQPPMYDELRYNHNSMTYETRSQTMKIRELEHQLGQEQLKKIVKEEDEKTKLKNLIAYYYNR